MKENIKQVWVAEIENPVFSECIQSLAFQYGFKWNGQKVNEPDHTEEKYLVFYPEENCIRYATPLNPTFTYGVTYDTPITHTLEQALNFFKNPPVKNPIVEKTDEKKMLPVVVFEYDSPNRGLTQREILATNYTLEYLEGFDIHDNNQFKRFKMSRITSPLEFLGFDPHP